MHNRVSRQSLSRSADFQSISIYENRRQPGRLSEADGAPICNPHWSCASSKPALSRRSVLVAALLRYAVSPISSNFQSAGHGMNWRFAG
jgi:hypothetical protein